MNPFNTPITLLLALVCPLCIAQDTATLTEHLKSHLAKPDHPDAELTSQMTHDRKTIEAMLDGYLVAFNASHDAAPRVRVGVPLASFADNLVHVAYSVADHQVMMQWHVSTLTHQGTAWKFNAFVNQSMTASIAATAHF